MLKAGSIYFAIFISLIVTILLGAIISITGLTNKFEDTYAIRGQIDANVNSALLLCLEDTSLVGFNSVKTIHLYDEESAENQVDLCKQIWGIYSIVTASSYCKNYISRKSLLTGSDPASGEPIALYLADKGRYLSVCGKTSLTGTCYLPKLGLRIAYVEGQSFLGDTLIKGETKISGFSLPPLSAKILSENWKYLGDSLPETDSVVPYEQVRDFDSIQQSFYDKTLLLVSMNPIILNNITLKGNIRVISAKALYVTSNAKLDNVILYGSSIYFNTEFKGSLQAFARDTIISGEGCKFEYPSCLGIINYNINGIYINLMNGTHLDGCVFLYQEFKATNAPMLIIGSNAIIQGQAYCPGKVEMSGRIIGSLYANQFQLHTISSYYEDLLFNASIDRLAVSKFISNSLVIPNYQRGKDIEWLN